MPEVEIDLDDSDLEETEETSSTSSSKKGDYRTNAKQGEVSDKPTRPENAPRLAPPMKAWALGHDGKYGFEVFEMELPYSLVERYCIKRHPPDTKMGALGRIQTGVVSVEQTPVGHYGRTDTDPTRDEGPLE